MNDHIMWLLSYEHFQDSKINLTFQIDSYCSQIRKCPIFYFQYNFLYLYSMLLLFTGYKIAATVLYNSRKFVSRFLQRFLISRFCLLPVDRRRTPDSSNHQIPLHLQVEAHRWP